MSAPRSYPSDVKDDEWAFVAPHLTLLRADAPQRRHPLRALLNALRYLAHTGCQWRYQPTDLPPWAAVYQQWTRWRDARVFEDIVHDLHAYNGSYWTGPPRPAPSSSTGGCCKARRRAGTGPATTGASDVRAARPTSPLIPWVSC